MLSLTKSVKLLLVCSVCIGVLYMTGQLSGIAATVLGILAAIFIVTSLVGTCPLYSVVGLSTVKKS